jgi:hypothetical protein
MRPPPHTLEKGGVRMRSNITPSPAASHQTSWRADSRWSIPQVALDQDILCASRPIMFQSPTRQRQLSSTLTEDSSASEVIGNRLQDRVSIPSTDTDFLLCHCIQNYSGVRQHRTMDDGGGPWSLCLWRVNAHNVLLNFIILYTTTENGSLEILF